LSHTAQHAKISASMQEPRIQSSPRIRPGATPGVGAGGYVLSEQAPIRKFMKRHSHKLWWVHTLYALGLGAFVAAFANKGFSHARWLIVSLGLAWLLIMLFFRFFGSGAREQRFATAAPGSKVQFVVMTYLLKNLYQGMLFFLLPFYFKSSTLDSPNIGFVALLAICAVVSTLDLVFDNVLMRSKTVASIFYALALFGCLNLVLPALVPSMRTIYTLMCAGSVTALAFWMLHIPLSTLRSQLNLVLLVASMAAGTAGAYFGRVAIPPVPMHLDAGAVGPMLLADGRLAMEVRSLHGSVIQQLQAVTDVVVPGGEGDRLRHVWRHEGQTVYTAPDATSRVGGPSGTIRLRSGLTAGELPKRLAGRWSVDVETRDGQLVGRVPFIVTE
jgi:hypothetical protein